MHDVTHSLDSLKSRALAFGAAPVVIEIRAATSGYDAALGRYRAALAVSVGLAVPGDEDSRYRVEHVAHLDADGPAATRSAVEIARLLADGLGVPVYPSAPEMPTDGTPRWLEQQGPSPERTWPVTWRTTVWDADGTTTYAEHETTVLAASGREALHRAHVQLSKGLAAPFECTLNVLDLDRPSTSYNQADPAASAPFRHTLRAWALDGRPLAGIVHAMRVEAPSLSPLEIMIALEHAFLVDLRDLTAAGAFCRGELDEGDLEAALGSVVAAQKPRWSLPLALLRAHANGQSIGPVLHQHYREVGGTIPLIMALRDAFGLSLMAAKSLADTACDGQQDEALSVMLHRAVRAIAAGERDDYRAMFS